MAERILITGGTGKTGRLLAALLSERGVATSIATRRPSARHEVRLDWADAVSQREALDGATAVYLVAPTARIDHLTAMRPLLESAVARDIGPLVLLSASSLDESGPMMGEVHRWLHDNARRWTALRPSWFMQNFVTHLLPTIQKEDRVYTATQDGSVPFIDAADIAAVAAEALTNPDFAPGERVLTGPEALTYDRAAQLIANITNRPVKHIRLTVPELADRYNRAGLPREYADLLAAMDGAIAEGAEDRTTPDVEEITGHSPRTLATFLSAHRADLARNADAKD